MLVIQIILISFVIISIPFGSAINLITMVIYRKFHHNYTSSFQLFLLALFHFLNSIMLAPCLVFILFETSVTKSAIYIDLSYFLASFLDLELNICMTLIALERVLKLSSPKMINFAIKYNSKIAALISAMSSMVLCIMYFIFNFFEVENIYHIIYASIQVLILLSMCYLCINAYLIVRRCSRKICNLNINIKTTDGSNKIYISSETNHEKVHKSLTVASNQSWMKSNNEIKIECERQISRTERCNSNNIISIFIIQPNDEPPMLEQKDNRMPRISKNDTLKKEWKISRIFLLVVVVYVLTRVPTILIILKVIEDENKVFQTVCFIFKSILFPYFYSFYSKQFRKDFSLLYKILKGKFKF